MRDDLPQQKRTARRARQGARRPRSSAGSPWLSKPEAIGLAIAAILLLGGGLAAVRTLCWPAKPEITSPRVADARWSTRTDKPEQAADEPEKSTDEPEEPVKQRPKVVPQKVSPEQPKEKPKEEPKESPKGQGEEKPKDQPAEKPKEQPAEKPKEQPKEKPAEPPREVPEEAPPPPPANLRAPRGVALVDLGATTNAPAEGKLLLELKKVSDNSRLILRGLDFANKHPEEPADMTLLAVRDRSNPQALQVALNSSNNVAVRFIIVKEKGANWLKYVCTKTSFTDRESSRLRSLRYCVLEIKGDAGSEAVALQEPLLVAQPVRLESGAATVAVPVWEFDLFLGEGNVYLGGKPDSLKEAMAFGEGTEAVRSHKCEALAKKYKVQDVVVALDKINRATYEIRVQATRTEPPKAKEGEGNRDKRLAEIDRAVKKNTATKQKIAINVKNADNPRLQDKALAVLSEVLEIECPQAPNLPRTPPKNQDERDQREVANKQYKTRRLAFLAKAQKRGEDLTEQNVKLLDERRQLVTQKTGSQAEAERRLMGGIRAVSAVLYRVVEGIRVDTVVIKDAAVAEEAVP